MKKEDIIHLSKLARIELQEEEIAQFAHDFDAILGYVDQVKDLAQAHAETPVVPPLHNVFREDTDPTPGGAHTEELLRAAPRSRGRYVEVKKVLDNK